jgi:metal-responsive CopG/Arc/MetJ family transcriptional regulator
MELETAKQIIEEIFHARSSEVDEMIRMRLEEMNWTKESWQEEEEPWPREFWVEG